MTKEEAKKILTEYVKACREDDMLTLEQFTYEEVIEAMDIGAEAISVLPVSSDLEEAAGEYAEKHGFRVPYDGSDNFYDDIDVKASKEGFIAGAKWQRKQMMKDGLDAIKSGQSNKIEKTIAGVFVKYGMDLQKQQMMQEAVEGVVEDWNLEPHPEITIPLNPEEFTAGDKVKLILIKED